MAASKRLVKKVNVYESWIALAVAPPTSAQNFKSIYFFVDWLHPITPFYTPVKMIKTAMCLFSIAGMIF